MREATRFGVAGKPVLWLRGFGSNSLAWMALKLPAMERDEGFGR